MFSASDRVSRTVRLSASRMFRNGGVAGCAGGVVVELDEELDEELEEELVEVEVGAAVMICA